MFTIIRSIALAGAVLALAAGPAMAGPGLTLIGTGTTDVPTTGPATYAGELSGFRVAWGIGYGVGTDNTDVGLSPYGAGIFDEVRFTSGSISVWHTATGLFATAFAGKREFSLTTGYSWDETNWGLRAGIALVVALLCVSGTVAALTTALTASFTTLAAATTAAAAAAITAAIAGFSASAVAPGSRSHEPKNRRSSTRSWKQRPSSPATASEPSSRSSRTRTSTSSSAFTRATSSTHRSRESCSCRSSFPKA